MTDLSLAPEGRHTVSRWREPTVRSPIPYFLEA